MKSADEIVNRALTLIDEQVTDILDAATTEMSVREMALEILPTVCRDLVKELPFELKSYLAESGTLVADTLGVGENQDNYFKKKVVFTAPSDFWELVAIRLTPWARPVTKYISVGTREYEIQNNPFTRSGKQNPTVAVSGKKNSTGMRVECFSIHEGDLSTVELFTYVSFDNVPDNEGNGWPDELFDEITKALATELNTIKSRFEDREARGEETLNAIEQHE